METRPYRVVRYTDCVGADVCSLEYIIRPLANAVRPYKDVQITDKQINSNLSVFKIFF